MERAIVDAPRVRTAGSLGLIEEDLLALRAFRCFDPPGAWFEREARKALNAATGHLAANTLRERDRILLFEWDDELLAVAVFAEESPETALMEFVGLAHNVHGAHTDDGDRLSDAVISSSLDEAQRLGFSRVIAKVARGHVRSRAMLSRVGFELVSLFDHDYELHAVALT